jgi:Arc/MetJ-type ribon-helix-helix transcriptional regulator
MTKGHVNITLPPEYIKWLEKKVVAHDYGSVSHGITKLIRDEMRREEEKKK